MSDTILAKEIVELRAEVAELKEMIERLMDRTTEPKTHRTDAEIRGRAKMGSLVEKALEANEKPKSLVDVHAKLGSGKITGEKEEKKMPRRRRYPVPPQAEQVSKFPRVPEYMAPYKTVPIPQIPLKYETGDILNSHAIPLTPTVSGPPKHDPTLPVYKPA